MDNEPKRVPLNEFLAAGFQQAFSMTREQAWEQGVCVSCKQEPTFITGAGVKEYSISAMCEPCFDGMFAEEGE